MAAKTLMIVSPEDEMVSANPKVGRLALDLIQAPKELYAIADGHFGLLYYTGPRFDEALAVQAKFLIGALAVSLRSGTGQSVAVVEYPPQNENSQGHFAFGPERPPTASLNRRQSSSRMSSGRSL